MMYNFEKARIEADKIKELVGEEGKSEDYAIAERLLEESGEIEMVELGAPEDGAGVEPLQEREGTPVPVIEEEGQVKRLETTSYVYNEINRLGERLVDFKKKERRARDEQEREGYKAKVSFFREELEKAKAQRDEVKKETESRVLKFERLLKGRFEEFKDGTWESMVPEIDAVQINRKRADKEGMVRSLGVNVFWINNGEKNIAHFELLEDGSLAGRMPIERGLNIDKDELIDDILHTVETVDMSFFENVHGGVLHAGAEFSEKVPRERLKESMGADPVSSGSIIDPRRLEFMSRQGKVLFGITDKEYGFDGYRGFVFPNFVVLESEKVGNAVFFIKLPKPLVIDEKRFNLPPEKRLTHEERKKILEEYIEQYIGSNKSKLVSMGAERKYHPHMSNEEWEVKMQQEIDKRLTESRV